jgi:hypothetical protein
MKIGKLNLILISTAIILVAGGLYYYFVATLSLSDIVGNTNSPIVNIGLRLIDFNTGLTRYDISNLKQKAPYWVNRMKEVDNIYNANEKSKESMRLMEEMTGDPTLRKIANKFGIGDIKKIFSVISSIQ